MKVYLVCVKESNEYHPILMEMVIKVHKSLENAKDKMKKYADACIASDSNWYESDTNGVNFIELRYRGATTIKTYYILEKELED